jgi:hypothetical protein
VPAGGKEIEEFLANLMTGHYLIVTWGTQGIQEGRGGTSQVLHRMYYGFPGLGRDGAERVKEDSVAKTMDGR